mmetsp:Transcript_16956/g.25507  ORF Transcript_16956/g.25507 Transcript_16956/m.25507 type:complete len:261 (+) Transcript_16956:1952-2734(+)
MYFGSSSTERALFSKKHKKFRTNNKSSTIKTMKKSNKYKTVLIPLILCTINGVVWSEEEGEIGQKRVYRLEHEIGGEWHARGQVVIRYDLSRSKMAQIVDAPVLKGEESAKLWSACFKDDSVYRIRAIGQNNKIVASTSVAACDLFVLRFSESLELQLDAQARLLSLAYRNLPASVSLPPQEIPEIIEFKSSAVVTTSIVGQIIPIQIQAPKPAGMQDTSEPALGDDSEKQSNDQKNKGFFCQVLAYYYSCHSPRAYCKR